MSSTERERWIEEMVTRYRRLLEERVAAEPRSLDEIEETVERIGREMDRQLERRILEELERKHQHENQAHCSCGGRARYRATHSRQVVTRHAEHSLSHRYYYCSECRRGFAPLDPLLGLDRWVTTTQVRLMAAHVGARLPFADAAATLRQLTAVRLGASTIERITLACGRSLVRAQEQRAEHHRLGKAAPSAHRLQRLYVGMDGKMVPLRDPWKRDGSNGALSCRFGECKVGVVYEAKRSPKGDQGVLRSRYLATMGEAAQFGKWMATAAHEQGHHWAKEVVVLGDGAAWIWQLAATHFPGALQIVDFYHASKHLGEVADLRFGTQSAAGKEWVRTRQAELLEGQVERVITAIAAWKPRNAERRLVRRNQLKYFRDNAERMRYGTFRAKGYHIGSGVVEASCKYVVGSRLDQAGMHWRRDSAEAVTNLRAALLSSQPPDLRPHCARIT
jgi:hypothetical protein